jgi:predicted dehydrogenase
MSTPVNSVVVGYGYSGQRIHVPLIRLAPEVRLWGVCSGDAAKREQVRQGLGCRTYERFEQVLEDSEVKLVVLATPNALHASQAIAALRAGKHVVVDKPMCLSSAEANEMMGCAEAQRRVLTVFHNRRLDGDYLTLKHLMESGELGEVRWLEMAWQRPGLPRTWKQQAGSGGGRLLDLGSHLLDQTLQLFRAKVVSVYCRMHHDWPGVDIESHAMLTLSFADGRTAVIDTGSMSHVPKPRILAVGDKATYVKHGMDPQDAALAAGDIDSARELPSQWGEVADGKTTRPIETLQGRWRSFYGNVGRVLQGEDSFAGRDNLLVKPGEVARVVRILELAGRSAVDGAVQSADV